MGMSRSAFRRPKEQREERDEEAGDDGDGIPDIPDIRRRAANAIKERSSRGRVNLIKFPPGKVVSSPVPAPAPAPAPAPKEPYFPAPQSLLKELTTPAEQLSKAKSELQLTINKLINNVEGSNRVSDINLQMLEFIKNTVPAMAQMSESLELYINMWRELQQDMQQLNKSLVNSKVTEALNKIHELTSDNMKTLKEQFNRNLNSLLKVLPASEKESIRKRLEDSSANLNILMQKAADITTPRADMFTAVTSFNEKVASPAAKADFWAAKPRDERDIYRRPEDRGDRDRDRDRDRDMDRDRGRGFFPDKKDRDNRYK
jgi:hypothetical protein